MDDRNQRNVSVIKDADGNKIVVINDIRFKGKRSVNWEDVEKYLRQYVGEFYSIAEDSEIIYIGSDLHALCTSDLWRKWRTRAI